MRWMYRSNPFSERLIPLVWSQGTEVKQQYPIGEAVTKFAIGGSDPQQGFYEADPPCIKGCSIFSETSPSTGPSILWLVLYEGYGRSYEEAVGRIKALLCNTPEWQWLSKVDGYKDLFNR